MCVPVNSSMLRANRGSSILGGPSRSPSARTLRTGVSCVTDRTPISARTAPNNTNAAIAVYLISDIFSLHDLRGPSANRDACYRSRPVSGIASHFSIERFGRGHGNIFLSRERWTLARAAQSRRQAAGHLRSGRLYRAPPPLPRSRCPRRRHHQLYATRIPALHWPARRRQNVRAAALSADETRANDP